ncbi:MAG: hypothetical protein II994_03310 [Lachnospiraceae bacterium]|nr:hypothetical protein [Lachnospiraceae bacterium]
MYKKYEKAGSIFCGLLMCISLVLLMVVGFYNHATGDDYYYAAVTRHVFAETGSLWQTFLAAAQGVAEKYMDWQGTYSGMFLMYLPPNVFGEECYKLVTTVLLLIYTACVFYFWKPLCCKLLQGSKAMWCMVSAVFVLLTVQTVPFIGESFFWYNGSMYYTGFFAVTLFFFGLMSRYLLGQDGRKESRQPFRVAGMALLAIFLAGGNYVSLLPTIIITVTIAAVLFYKRSPKAKWIALVALFLILGLIVSAAAPGNQVRQETSWGISAPKAIAKSLLQGLSYLGAWLNLWWLLAATVLTPVFWNSYKHLEFRFRYPVIVLGYAYGVFCSMSCPTFYAMNSTGPARALAIVYYGFMLFTIAGYYYGLGYVHRVLTERKKTMAEDRVCMGCLGISAMLLVVLAITGNLTQCNSVTAVKLLQSGEAAAYEAEFQERLLVLYDETVQDVVFEPYRNQPAMLFVGDFTGDVENVNNIRIAEYFKKNSIRVDY